MPYPGSTDELVLELEDGFYDNTTGATVVVTGKDATGATVALTPTATSADGKKTWLAHPQYTAAGTWIAHWTVTGTGEGQTEQTIQVSLPASPAAAVTWRPELWHVAAYIPRRTLVGAVDGYGNALDTFTSDTHPRAGQVQSIVSDACAWVGLAVNAVEPTLGDAARGTAALYAAAMVELTYPDNRDDLSTAEQLLARAEAMRTDLDRANTAITGTDPEDPSANLLSVFSFPAPAWYGDLTI